MRLSIIFAILLVFLIAAAVTNMGTARAATGPIAFSGETPGPGSATGSTTPTISVSYSDKVSTIDTSSVFLYVDGVNVTTFSDTTITSSGVTYATPSILSLKNGLHNVSVVVSDLSGNTAQDKWNFTVNTNITSPPANPLSGVKPLTLLFYTGIVAALAGAAVGGYILFLKQTTRFTFRRYFATHHVEARYYTLYIPMAAAFFFILFGLSLVYSNPSWPSNAVDYVFIIAIFIGLTAFGVDARREMLRIRAFERAFAQFLFELADAMRGGLDPAKSIVELAKTYTNILAKPLRVASDGIRLGRPLDSVLTDMAKPMQSSLINRYAGLIAEATAAGGETALVVYRAAKDMDDFVKIEEEREKQLMLPVAVIYIAFSVLMAVLFALLYIAPELGTLNISFIGLGGLPSSSSSATTSVPRLDFTTLKERFFELMVINALGTGAIIGAFTEGRARYGILHSLALVAATAIAFAIVFP
ncbi:MAG TPA: type II secretion system F family protein [Thermoplasmata archaeon]|nr:type II secretion system F family protein [Thermoplasmata archaeon]